MISCKDTTSLPIPDASELKIVASKKMNYFNIKARSRSYQSISDLNHEDEDTDDIMSSDSFYGVGYIGQFFVFAPEDYSITEDYIEEKKVFEDALSPTVVYTSKHAETGKVSKVRCIS